MAMREWMSMVLEGGAMIAEWDGLEEGGLQRRGHTTCRTHGLAQATLLLLTCREHRRAEAGDFDPDRTLSFLINLMIAWPADAASPLL